MTEGQCRNIVLKEVPFVIKAAERYFCTLLYGKLMIRALYQIHFAHFLLSLEKTSLVMFHSQIVVDGFLDNAFGFACFFSINAVTIKFRR